MTIDAPVMKSASGEARKTTTPAISPGLGLPLIINTLQTYIICRVMFVIDMIEIKF